MAPRFVTEDGLPKSTGSTVTDVCFGVFSSVMKDGCSNKMILCDVVARRWLHSLVPRLPRPPVMAIVLVPVVVLIVWGRGEGESRGKKARSKKRAEERQGELFPANKLQTHTHFHRIPSVDDLHKQIVIDVS